MEKEAKDSRKAPLRYVLIYTLQLVVFTAAALCLLFPHAKKNLGESRLGDHIQAYRKEKSRTAVRVLSVPLYSGERIEYSPREIDEKGRDDIHLMIEAMLMPLSEKEKSSSLSSAVPEKTKLMGASEKKGYFFIELSDDFLKAEDIKKALSQLRLLLQELKNVEELTVISSGRIIRESQELR